VGPDEVLAKPDGPSTRTIRRLGCYQNLLPPCRRSACWLPFAGSENTHTILVSPPHHLRSPRPPPCPAPCPPPPPDVALAFLSPVSLSPVFLSPLFLDLARKSGLPDLRAILRNPGKPGFRWRSPWSDGLPPSPSSSSCRWLPRQGPTRRLGRTGTQRDR